MPPPRLPPLPLDPLPPACGAWLDALPRNALVGRLAPVNVLGTLLYAPTVLPDFLRYWSAVGAGVKPARICRHKIGALPYR